MTAVPDSRVDDDFLPYGRHDVTEADAEAVRRALFSGWLTTGPAVDRFEHALASVCGGMHVAVVNSGTAALHAAYAATGLGPGHEVVTSPLTFAATATTALHLGATVRFADVADDTLTLDPAAAAAATTAKTHVITAVDYAGQPADLDPLMSIARDADAFLLEDAAHALGATYKGQPVGSVADLTTFSFHPVKTVTTAEGGAVSGRDSTLVDAVRRFRNHGLVRELERLRRPDEGGWHQEIQSLGLNYRLPDVLAALGASQLVRLEQYVGERNRLVAGYRELFKDVPGVDTIPTAAYAAPAWHLLAVRIRNGRRREVYDHLRSVGIGAQVHYLPAHLHPLFEDLGYGRGSCPNAERAYEELLSLPLFPGLSDRDLERVVHEVRTSLGEV